MRYLADPRRDAVTQVAASAGPTRRRAYDHVVRPGGPVGRDDVAAALGALLAGSPA